MIAPPIQEKRFDHLSDPGVAEFFREAIAGGPLTARPLPKLVERLVAKPWAERLCVRVTRTQLVLGREEGPQVRVVFWQHIQTFQVFFREAGATAETTVGQGTHVGLAERMVSEAAARLLA